MLALFHELALGSIPRSTFWVPKAVKTGTIEFKFILDPWDTFNIQGGALQILVTSAILASRILGSIKNGFKIHKSNLEKVTLASFLKKWYFVIKIVLTYSEKKLFWPNVRKNCSSVGEKLLKFMAEGREFAKILDH